MKRLAGWMLAVGLAACAAPGVTGTFAGAVPLKVRFVDARTRNPLSGVKACVAERPELPCATTDADGRLEAQVPEGEDIQLECLLATHIPMYMTLHVPRGPSDVGEFRLLDHATASLFRLAGGGPLWPNHGIILANVYDELEKRENRVAGVQFSVAPQASPAAYAGEGGLPDKTLTASTAGGPGAFLDVPPGDFTVTVKHPDRTCLGGFGWRKGATDQLGTRVFPGAISTVTFVCAANP